jgi:hypothetical protein
MHSKPRLTLLLLGFVAAACGGGQVAAPPATVSPSAASPSAAAASDPPTAATPAPASPGATAGQPSPSAAASASARPPHTARTPIPRPSFAPPRTVEEAIPKPRTIEPVALVDVELEALVAADDALYGLRRVGDIDNPTPQDYVEIHRIDPATNRATRVARMDRAISTFAVGFGSIWGTNYDGGRVDRHDLASGELVAEIRTGPGPDGITVHDGSVWVVNHGADWLSRIDPESGEATQIRLGTAGRAMAGVVPAWDLIWVTGPFARALLGIDPSTDELVKTVPVPMYPCSVGYVVDRLWVGACGGTEGLPQYPNEAAGAVVERDADAGAGLEGIWCMTEVGGQLWAMVDPTIYVALDPETLAPSDAISVEPDTCGMTEAFGAAWMVSGGQLARFDLEALSP